MDERVEARDKTNPRLRVEPLQRRPGRQPLHVARQHDRAVRHDAERVQLRVLQVYAGVVLLFVAVVHVAFEREL